MIISLIGYRGCGKSTVGAQLAARLGLPFADSDQLIQQRAGKSISEIFASAGEPVFRRYEREVLAELLTGSPGVVSAGGGAILDELTRRQMKLAGPVIWLRGTVETLANRIGSDPGTLQNRPALTSHSDLYREIGHVLEQREPIYAEAASIVLDTDLLTVTQLVDAIVGQLPAQYHSAQEHQG